MVFKRRLNHFLMLYFCISTKIRCHAHYLQATSNDDANILRQLKPKSPLSNAINSELNAVKVSANSKVYISIRFKNLTTTSFVCLLIIILQVALYR